MSTKLPPKIYYTPKYIIHGCTGLTVQRTTSLKEQPRFVVNSGNGVIRSTELGVEGIGDLARKLKDKGIAPEDFGKLEPFKINNISYKSESVIVNLRETSVTPQMRLTFQVKGTYGSFNRAVENALNVLSLHKKQAKALKLMKKILDDSDAYEHASESDVSDLIKMFKV